MFGPASYSPGTRRESAKPTRSAHSGQDRTGRGKSHVRGVRFVHDLTADHRLPCTLSLDLDDAWTYLRAAGRKGYETTPSVIPTVCERLLTTLHRHRAQLTLFVVGHDLDDERKVAAIRPLVQAGHEIGCHSQMHEPEFATLDRDQLEREILGCADRIEQVLGVRPICFRAPGFARNPHTPAVLEKGGFRCDGSFLPTFLGPIARMFYFMRSGLDHEARKKRGAMFGGFADAFGHLRAKPHRHAPSVLDLPVTTMPIFRLPFHLSYILWLSGKARWLARAYLATGLDLCRLTRTPPSYLLHSLDFLGRGEHPDLDFFPGMDVLWQDKLAMIDHLLAKLTRDFQVVPIGAFVEHKQAPVLAAH